MNSRDLEALFDEWARLTESETRAISGNDWDEVQRQQHQKEQLMARMNCCLEGLRETAQGREGIHFEFNRRLRPAIDRLISLELENSHLLSALREQTRRELTECNRAAENLRGLSRVYGPTNNSQWTSYS